MAVEFDRLKISGFKTIRDLSDFSLAPLNVLIGANGAGKSNLISFFRLLSWSLVPPGQLQSHVGMLGGASTLLHDGPGVTPLLDAGLRFRTGVGINESEFRLAHASGDALIYTQERYRFSSDGFDTKAPWIDLGAGHSEARLVERAEQGEQTARVIHALLRQCVVYQFHNTAKTARMRNKWNREDGRYLKEDAGNLAPFLFRLKEEAPLYYRRISETVRAILPFFAEFELEPDAYGKLLLRWRERDCDLVFDASQAADGMLRVMALAALLLQPEADLPAVLILDEPELGLHPYAIDVVAGLIRAASARAQVILATQSAALINYFDPEEVVVVERQGRESTYRRLRPEPLKEWLEEYSLAELWEKNLIGGKP